MKILNAELREIDFSNADNLELFENATKKAGEKIKNLETSAKNKTSAQVIREGCKVVFDCFDEIFGEGAAKAVFGETSSLKICLKAFRDLVDERNKQEKELEEDLKYLNNDYNPNRATRRANAKSKKANS